MSWGEEIRENSSSFPQRLRGLTMGTTPLGFRSGRGIRGRTFKWFMSKIALRLIMIRSWRFFEGQRLCGSEVESKVD
jgi:hypothetical protein